MPLCLLKCVLAFVQWQPWLCLHSAGCSGSSDTKCEACEDGSTFNLVHDRSTGCTTCKNKVGCLAGKKRKFEMLMCSFCSSVFLFFFCFFYTSVKHTRYEFIYLDVHGPDSIAMQNNGCWSIWCQWMVTCVVCWHYARAWCNLKCMTWCSSLKGTGSCTASHDG